MKYDKEIKTKEEIIDSIKNLQEEVKAIQKYGMSKMENQFVYESIIVIKTLNWVLNEND